MITKIDGKLYRCQEINLVGELALLKKQRDLILAKYNELKEAE